MLPAYRDHVMFSVLYKRGGSVACINLALLIVQSIILSTGFCHLATFCTVLRGSYLRASDMEALEDMANGKDAVRKQVPM